MRSLSWRPGKLQNNKTGMNRYIIPLAVFVALVVLFRIGLNYNPQIVPSPLIDKPAPAFTLPSLRDNTSIIKSTDLQGHAVLLNVWASWCIECRNEQPVLMEFKQKLKVPIYGLNYKDTRTDALQWLSQYGDPYIENAFDQNGRVGIDYGVYGVPETFVLDRNGIIRYKHIGPVTQQAMEDIILPLLNKLEHPAT
jgi:cytochrome c biogenesis protein CcmG/thiol:disulfide interchange protein DsbE